MIQIGINARHPAELNMEVEATGAGRFGWRNPGY